MDASAAADRPVALLAVPESTGGVLAAIFEVLLPTDEIAAEVGYGEPAFFGSLFERRTGATPARYRRRFARIARPA